MLTTDCPGCHARLRLPEKLASGQRPAHCPKCRQLLMFPQLPTNGREPATTVVAHVPEDRAFTQQPSQRVLPALAAGGDGLGGNWVLAVGAVAGLLGGLVFAGAAVLSDRTTGASNGPLPPANPPEAVRYLPAVTRGDEAFAAIREQNQSLKEDLKKLEVKLKALEQEKQKLSEQRQKLESEVQELKKKVVFVDRWKRATFVMLSPGRYAAGIYQQPDGRFQLLARAEHPWTDYADKVARKLGIQRIVEAPKLAEQLCGLSETSPIDAVLEGQIAQYWCARQYVPAAPDDDAEFVVFRDVEANGYRIGFFVAARPDALEFHPVAPSGERVPRSRIERGTARTGKGTAIKGRPETDFLDYAALCVAQKMASKASGPSYQSLVLEVDVDAIKGDIKQAKTPDVSLIDNYFEFRARLEGKPYIRNKIKEPNRQLLWFADFLEDDLHARLSRLRLPVLERERLKDLRRERRLADEGDSEDRGYRSLLCASHKLVVDVSHPRQGGAFRVSLRLVDLNTGQDLWADNGDVGRSIIDATTGFLVDSGAPAVLKPKRGATRTKPLPLHLPPLVGAALDAPRLVYLEPSLNRVSRSWGDLAFRDLFSTQIQHVDPECVAVVDDPAVATVGLASQMRFLAWAIARQALPRAGRVVSSNGEVVVVNYSAGENVHTGDVFQVVRYPQTESESPGNDRTPSVVPIELIATEAVSGVIKARVGDTDLAPLWPEESDIQVGDIAVRKGASAGVVEILPFEWDDALLPDNAASDFRTHHGNFRAKKQMDTTAAAKKLASKLQAALVRIGVPCFAGERRSSSRATCVLSCAIAPASMSPTTTSFSLALRLTDTQTRETRMEMPKFTLRLAQFEDWQP